MRLRHCVLGVTAAIAALSSCKGSDDDHDGSGSGGAGGEVTASGGAGRGPGGNAGEGGEPTSDPGKKPTELARLSTADYFDCSPPDGEIPVLSWRLIVDSMSLPMDVVPLPGDDSKLWIIEQGGRVRSLDLETTTLTTVLDIRSLVGRASSEEGLLGIAPHPKFEENGLFYVHYSADVEHPSATPGDTVIDEYRMSEDDPEQADPDSRRLVLVADREQRDGADHNGGSMFFGAGDYLYVTLGDGGGGGRMSEAQNFQNYLGTILRFDPSGGEDGERSAPPENYFDDEAPEEVWGYGLRNPFRASADGCTGHVYIGDVGLDSFEEVNVLRPDLPPSNFGWPILEGNQCWDSPCDGDFVGPVHQYPTSTSGSAIIGGSVYRGSELPGLRGRYFFADAASGRVWSSVFDDVTEELIDVRDHTLELTIPVITSLKNDNHGEIYATARQDGALYRLEARE